MNSLRSLMMDAKLVISRVVALTVALGLIGVVGTAPALADDKSCSCSTQMLAGHWVFATEVGQQKLLPGGDITAIGTVNLDRDGNLSGKFDATVAEFAFLPDNTFTGSVTVNPDCTHPDFRYQRRNRAYGQHRRPEPGRNLGHVTRPVESLDV